jgi:hypothetical protein
MKGRVGYSPHRLVRIMNGYAGLMEIRTVQTLFADFLKDINAGKGRVIYLFMR